MSIITAFYPFSGNGEPQERAVSMLNAMPYPAGSENRVWSDEIVGLGFREQVTHRGKGRLEIPLVDAESGCAISCDARIDNRDEITEVFSLDSSIAKETSDAGLILKAYLKWDSDLAQHLLGDFVFAIWDPRKRRLLCGRDPVGVRHFYYVYKPGSFFALASEVKALIALPGVLRDIDRKSVGDYLNFNFDDRERTFYSEVKRLPATHCLTVDERDLKLWEYWRPDGITQLKWKDPKMYFEAFRSEFTAAVRRRLRNAEPVGTFLSGGLDSSSITAVTARELAPSGKKLRTFSAVWPTVAKDHPRIDELEYMRSVIDHCGCDPTFVNCDDQNPWKDIDELIDCADHPVGFPNMYMHWEIYKAASNTGVKVLLDGFDGDTAVSHGYEMFADLARRGRWLRLFREARAVRQQMPHKFHSKQSLILRNGLDTVIPRSLKPAWSIVTRRGWPSAGTQNGFADRTWSTLNKEFQKEYRKLYDEIIPPTVNAQSLPVQHWGNLVAGIFGKTLEFSQIASRRFAVECRYPFLDRRFLEFCIAIPADQRIQAGWTRGIFREALKGDLPELVRCRVSKANIGTGLKLNLVRHSLGDLEQSLRQDPEVISEFVDTDRVREIIKTFASNPLGTFDSHCLTLVAIVHLSKWLKKMVAN
jgi:asparagine synthase (glutamine-hydrolysing)